MNRQQSTWVFRKSMGLEYVGQYGLLDMVRNARQTFCPVIAFSYFHKKERSRYVKFLIWDQESRDQC